jgi:uncharacterized protein
LLVTAAIVGAAVVAAALVSSPLFEPWRPAGQDGQVLAALAAWQVVVVLLTLAVTSLRRPSTREALALGPARRGGHDYLAAVALLVALNIVVSAVQYFLIPQDMFADLRLFVGFATGPDWLLALLVIGVGAPLSEELLFRGFLLQGLARSRLGFAGAALISTTIWAAMHAGYSVVGLVEVFLIGLLFSWLLWKTGSVRVAIFCHALYNSLIVLILRYVPLPAAG